MIRALLTLTALLLALTAACGDDDEATPTPDQGFGGSFPRHLASIAPENGTTVTNDALAEGICAGFAFAGGDGMGDDPTSLVKMFVQGEEFTDSVEWEVTASQPPTHGTMCYTPESPFPAGPITMAVRWSEVSGRQFVYNWQFTVSE